MPSTSTYNVKDYGAVGNNIADDTTAVQAAAAAVVSAGGGTLLFPRGAYRVAASVTLGPNVVVQGDGWPTITATTIAPLFVYTTPNGTQSPQAPHFVGLKCYGRNIIKLNDTNNGFTDDSTTQYFLMKPAVIDCDFFSDSDGLGIGIQMSKAFDCTITRCWVGGFSVNVDLHGCDIGIVDNNRFAGGSVAQVRLTSYGTFGSHTNISRNDMLDLKSGSYILSSDFDLRVRDNFFESSTHVIDSVIKTTGGYALRISGNRVDVPSSLAPNWLDVGQPVTVCEVTNNHTTGGIWGPAKFPAGGALYYYSSGQRQKIVHYGNSSAAGIPMNSVESVPLEPHQAYLWTPDLPPNGFSTGNYGLSARVADGALVLPNMAGYGSLVTFATGITGAVTAHMLLKGGQAGQVVNVQVRNGSSVLWTDTYTLTTSYAVYDLTTGPEAHTDLQVLFWVNSGVSVSIKSIGVRWP